MFEMPIAILLSATSVTPLTTLLYMVALVFSVGAAELRSLDQVVAIV